MVPFSVLEPRHHESAVPRVVLAHPATRTEFEISRGDGNGFVGSEKHPKDDETDQTDRHERERGLFFFLHASSLAEGPGRRKSRHEPRREEWNPADEKHEDPERDPKHPHGLPSLSERSVFSPRRRSPRALLFGALLFRLEDDPLAFCFEAPDHAFDATASGRG
jgi:hypothetical protein